MTFFRTLAFCAVLSAPANAALLNYAIEGQGHFISSGPLVTFSASFQLDTTTLQLAGYGYPERLKTTGLAATLAMSPFYASGAGMIDEIDFYSASDGGGFDLGFTRDGQGPQGLSIADQAFFTGTLASPTFITGTFSNLSDYFLNDFTYNVTVTDVTSPGGDPQPVPEPGTLGVLTLGTALIGATLRRQRCAA